MNRSRSPSPSSSRQLPPRLSASRRNARQSSLSVLSPGDDQVPITPADAGAEDQQEPGPTITEEISEIKRYEDFTTIDWVQDAIHEQARRRARRERGAQFWDKEGAFGWRRKVSEAYDAGQAWLVITIVGAAIGLNSAALNIITEWLSDIKLGYCTTAFYLNESFCCWEVENGCPEWKKWSSLPPVNYTVYFIFAVLFAFLAAALVQSFAPYAAGSGITEIKVIIAGFIMKGFLGAKTLLIKSITLPLAIASNLSIGKEGPSVHFAVCTGNVMSRWFGKYRRSASKTREVLTATAAAGVAVAFGSPIGGVLFSLEEMASYFPLKTLWRSYFCALVATGVLAAMNPFRTGQLVMFQVQYDQTWHLFELIFFALLGVFGGLYGAFVIKWNLRAVAFRKKYLSRHPILEATVLAGVTALVFYPNMFLRINMTEMMEILFRECGEGHDYHGICEAANRWPIVMSLFMATLLRLLFVTVSYGCKVPAGIFVPSMAIGASFGRMVGMMVQALQETFPGSQFFASCEPDVPCITPGTYAFLGAGAALSGIMHLTISVTVIMFELTGALTYILPTMIVVGVTKFVSTRFGKGGIADRMIWFNGFPFLDTKEDHIFNVPVSHTMTNKPICLPATDLPVSDAQRLLDTNKFQGYPIVENSRTKTLVGFIGRTELQYAINRARHQGLFSPNAVCRFTSPRRQDPSSASVTTSAVPLPSRRVSSMRPEGSQQQQQPPQEDSDSGPPRTFEDIATSSGIRFVDFSQYVDFAPLTVHPRHPLETVMEIFKKMGPRVILVEYRGRLMGLVTVKDCLKYQFKVEAEEHADTQAGATAGGGTGGGNWNAAGGTGQGLVEQKAWELIQWAIKKVKFWERRDSARPGLAVNQAAGERERQRRGADIVDGTEVDSSMELEERAPARREDST